MVTISVSTRLPSVARKVTGYDPCCVKFGVQLNVAVPSPLFVNVDPVGRVDELNVGMVPSGSVADMLKLRLTPSLTERGPIAAKTGAWFPLFTVMVTISVSTRLPSVARNVTG